MAYLWVSARVETVGPESVRRQRYSVRCRSAFDPRTSGRRGSRKMPPWRCSATMSRPPCEAAATVPPHRCSLCRCSGTGCTGCVTAHHPRFLKILKIGQNLTELGTIINEPLEHSIFDSFPRPCSGTREEGAHQCLHFLQSRLQPAVFKRPPPICDAKPTTPTHHCRPSRSFWPRRRLQHTCAAIFWGKKYMPYLFPPCFLKESNIYAPAPYSPGAHEQRRQPWAKRRAAAKKNLFILLS